MDYNDLTVQEQIEKASNNGYAIKHIHNPCLEVQLAAVKRDSCAIEYIDNPCLEVQLAAVKKNSYAVQYIECPYLEVQIYIIKQDRKNIKYINPHPRILNYLNSGEERYLYERELRCRYCGSYYLEGEKCCCA